MALIGELLAHPDGFVFVRVPRSGLGQRHSVPGRQCPVPGR